MLLDPTTEPHRHDVAVQAIAAIDATPEGQALKAWAAELVSSTAAGVSGSLLAGAGSTLPKLLVVGAVGFVLYQLWRR
jgi:hypothetical protein